MTVNWTSAQQTGERHALACSPDVATWLHDEVVQRLSSVVAALGANTLLEHADQARCRAELEVAVSALRLLLDDRILQPGRRLRSVVEAVRAGAVAHEVPAPQVRISGDAEISPTTGELIADFVAETMRNVVKHAEAHAIELTVTIGEHEVRVVAFNDGVMPTSSGIGAGIGLRLLAARALDHRGFVFAGATSPDGWTTTLTLMRSSPAPTSASPSIGAAS